jgi:hypothetical protein
MPIKYPVTPDGRYFVVRGRLWRMANPKLDEDEKIPLVRRLMTARRADRITTPRSPRTTRLTKQNARSASVAKSGGMTVRRI